MPCYDSRDDPSYVRAETEHEIRRDCRHNSDVAELLCWLLKNSPAARNEHCRNNPKLAKWWAEHQARDKAKEKKHGKSSKR